MARAGVATIFHGNPDGTHGDGEQVAIAATSSPGTLLYTNVAGAGIVDAITIEIGNIDSVDRDVIIEWAGTATKDRVPYTIPAGQTLVVIDRRLLSGGNEVRAYCTTANVLNAYVEVYQYNIQG